MSRPARPLEERFWERVQKTSTCWLWLGPKDKGYGRIGRGGRGGGQLQTHRLAWELENGPIREGMTLDHLCRTPACVRPDHLEVVTRGENTRRGGNSVKTHCKRGHPFDAANTYRYRGGRWCRTCRRDYLRRWRARREEGWAA